MGIHLSYILQAARDLLLMRLLPVIFKVFKKVVFFHISDKNHIFKRLLQSSHVCVYLFRSIWRVSKCNK